MDAGTKQKYDQYIKEVRVSKDILDTAREKGKFEGRLEGKIEMILGAYDIGIDITQISQAAEMSVDEIKKILKENNR